MTPKEKAKSLVQRHRDSGYFIRDAIELSIICVDEIIKSNPMEVEYIEGEKETTSTAWYWHQVKQELKNM